MAYLLIIDDDQDFTEATAMALRNAGHEVEYELTPENGLESIRKRRPDLIILDVMFPENSSAGFELARTIRQEHFGGPPIPVLMLTAVNTKFPLGFGKQDIDEDWLPISDFVEKPVDFDVLSKKVEHLLEKAKG